MYLVDPAIPTILGQHEILQHNTHNRAYNISDVPAYIAKQRQTKRIERRLIVVFLLNDCDDV